MSELRTEQEMTLDQWVTSLPESHLAVRQYREMQARLKALEPEYEDHVCSTCGRPY